MTATSDDMGFGVIFCFPCRQGFHESCDNTECKCATLDHKPPEELMVEGIMELQELLGDEELPSEMRDMATYLGAMLETSARTKKAMTKFILAGDNLYTYIRDVDLGEYDAKRDEVVRAWYALRVEHRNGI